MSRRNPTAPAAVWALLRAKGLKRACDANDASSTPATGFLGAIVKQGRNRYGQDMGIVFRKAPHPSLKFESPKLSFVPCFPSSAKTTPSKLPAGRIHSAKAYGGHQDTSKSYAAVCMRFSNEGQASTVSLQLSQAPSSQATTALTQELIKHFLFVRNQIPGLFSDLEQQVRDSAQVL